MAPPKRKNPPPDSFAANLAASRTLTRLIATGVVKPTENPQKWYKHPLHCQAFAPIHPEKFRKSFRKLLSKKYDAVSTRSKINFYFSSNCPNMVSVSPGVSKLRSPNTNTASTPVDDDEEDGIDHFVLQDDPEEVLFKLVLLLNRIR